MSFKYTEMQKRIIDSGSTRKSVVISFPNANIDSIGNNKIYEESMSLEDSLLDSESLVFGKCNSAIFKIRLADFEENVKSEEISVKILFENAELGTFEMPFGKYTIVDADKTSDKRFTDITAYDYMIKFDVDIADWYNNVLYPSKQIEKNMGWKLQDENGIAFNVTYNGNGLPKENTEESDNDKLYLDNDTGIVYIGVANYTDNQYTKTTWEKHLSCEKNTLVISDSDVKHTINELVELLCKHIGVEYDKDYKLVNGDLSVGKNINPSVLKGRTFLEQICEANGVFGHFDFNGVLNFVDPHHDSYIDSNNKLHINTNVVSYSDNKVTLKDSVFNKYANKKLTINSDVSNQISIYKSCEFSDNDVLPVNSLQIRTSKDDVGITVYDGTQKEINQYVITGNSMFYGIDTTEELERVANNILSVVKNVYFRPNQTSVYGSIYMGLGNSVYINSKIVNDNGVVEYPFLSIVLKRTIHGIQAIFNDISASGGNWKDQTTNSISDSIEIINNNEKNLTENLDALKANFNSLNSKTITAENLSSNVAKFGYLYSDFANIKTADIESAKIKDLLVQSGWFDKATIQEGYAFKLIGDLIKANTLALEELVFVDDIGNPSINLVYRINELTGGLDKESYTEEELSKKLNGKDLIANSVTANEINVGSLTGNEAFINSISSNKVVVKASEDSTSALEKAQGIEDNIYTPNTTTIDGGKITTNTIDANAIRTGSVLSNDITATDLTITGTSKFISSGSTSTVTIENGAIDILVDVDNNESYIKMAEPDWVAQRSTEITSWYAEMTRKGHGYSQLTYNSLVLVDTKNSNLSSISPSYIKENGVKLEDKYMKNKHTYDSKTKTLYFY